MPSAADVIKIATTQVGVHEGHNTSGWNNIQRYSKETPGFAWSDGQPWCDTFVAWCSWRAGFDTANWPRSASCDTSGSAFKKIGRWSEYPAVGGQVFFGTSSDLQHTGIVTAYDDTYIHTVEGNTNATGSYQGDGVYAKIHERRDVRVIGYGYPDFPEGITSADPAWQGTKPASKGPTPRGVDISHYQGGPILYGAAMGAGVRWLYHKATEGTTYADPNHDKRRAEVAAVRDGLLRRRLHFGAYHFARPKVGNAAAEAAHFLATAQPKSRDMVPMLDLEDDGGLPRAALTTWVKTWVTVVAEACGAKPIIYTRFDLDDNFGCLLWVARYSNDNRDPVVPKPWTRWDLWQFSDGVYGVPNSVPGLGHVDLDTMRPGLKVRELRIPRKARPKPPPPPPVPTTFTVRVATANLGNGDNTQVIAGLRALAKVADVIGCQEAGDRGGAISRFLRAGTWSAYFGDKPGAPSVPILYDAAVLEVVASEAVVAVPQRDVVPKGVKKVGAGPATIKQKIDQHVTFRHKATGGEFDVVNTHFIASATRHDMSKGETHGRRKHYTDHVTALLKLVESLPRPVVVTADWNATTGFKPLAPVVALLTGWTTEATEKRRAIDHVVHTADVTTLGVQTLDGFSDHKYVAAELEVTTSA